MTLVAKKKKKSLTAKLIKKVMSKYNYVAEDLEREAAKDKLWEMGYPFAMWSYMDREGKILQNHGRIDYYKDIQTWEEGIVLCASMIVVDFNGEEQELNASFDISREDKDVDHWSS